MVGKWVATAQNSFRRPTVRWHEERSCQPVPIPRGLLHTIGHWSSKDRKKDLRSMTRTRPKRKNIGPPPCLLVSRAAVWATKTKTIDVNGHGPKKRGATPKMPRSGPAGKNVALRSVERQKAHPTHGAAERGRCLSLMFSSPLVSVASRCMNFR
jgi:hypothetical protein